MADYHEGDSVQMSTELVNWMQNNLDAYLETVTEGRPPSNVDAATVFEGVGGRAYIFMRLYMLTNDKKYLDMAAQYMKTSLANVDSIDKKYVGFLWGSTGVFTLAAILSTMQQRDDDAVMYISKVQSFFDVCDDDSKTLYDDFDGGRAGLLYASEFLDRYYGRKVISRESLVGCANAIIRRGKVNSDAPDHYMQWMSGRDDGKWLGQSHGSAGVLGPLLDVPELLVEGSESRRLIIGTFDYLVSKQFASGNFPSEYYAEDADELVQWDHGAPGVQGALIKAAKVLDNSSYEASARLAADCTWQRGLLYKGLELCHGIVGNTYMQLYMHKMTADPKFLYRAYSFQQFVMATPELSDVNLMRKPTPNPYSFYTGSWEGAIMLWADMLAHQTDPELMAMPGYEPYL